MCLHQTVQNRAKICISSNLYMTHFNTYKFFLGEVLNTVENTGLRWRDRGIVEGTEITGTTEIKLLRARAMR